MSYYLEITSPDSILALAGALAELSGQLEQVSAPPEPDFGGDQFGQAMRAKYPVETVLQLAIHKLELAEAITSLSDGIAGAVTELVAQDDDNASALNSV
jgi:hypothetical protein